MMTVDTVKALAEAMAGSAFDEYTKEGLRFGGTRENYIDLNWRQKIVPAQVRINVLAEQGMKTRIME